MSLKLRYVLAIVSLLGVTGVGLAVARPGEHERRPPARTAPLPEDTRSERPLPPARTPSPPRPPGIRWRESVAVGRPWAGRLVHGVRLPARGRDFRTWDPVLKRSPGRAWRRVGTDDLVRTILAAAGSYRRAHPLAPPVLVGDLSRPRGGDFGPRFGSIGHVTHQNGLDVDVYYPRLDRGQRAARRVDQVDRRLAQALVHHFVLAGAVTVLVGPNTGLTGRLGRVKPFPNHDDHLHARIAPRP